jgi:hypothetical protein
MSPGPPPVPSSYDPLAAARQAREEQAAPARSEAQRQPLPPPPAAADPLSYCVWTTVALLAWALTPGLAVAVFGAAGLWAYARAWRAGLRHSDCLLRDPRLVMLYLGLAALAGIVKSALSASPLLHLLAARW